MTFYRFNYWIISENQHLSDCQGMQQAFSSSFGAQQYCSNDGLGTYLAYQIFKWLPIFV